MKTNNNISIRRGRASISSLNRIKRVFLWVVGIIGAILGLVLWVFLRPIFRGVGWGRQPNLRTDDNLLATHFIKLN